MAETAGCHGVSSVPLSHDSSALLAGKKPTALYRRLYVQVLAAVVLGALFGWLYPELAQTLKPVGDMFIRLVRMMIEPIIFTTVVVGVARMHGVKAVGRVGLKALIYFEVVTGVALLIGLIVANLAHPGQGIALDLAAANPAAPVAVPRTAVDFMLHIVPESVVGAFARGETLQVLFFAVLFGLGLSAIGAPVRPLIEMLDQVSQGLFGVIGFIMKVAPIGAFGAMAFTIGKYGVGTLQQLGLLLASVYLTCLLFIALVLGIIARCAGFSLWRFLRFIREEIVIVLGTSTSESALPGLMSKLEALGCERSVVGLVVPTGYAFNLDGSTIYLSMAVLFIAQAAGIHLGWQEQMSLMGLLLLTSKGSAAVTGGGFIALAATLSSIGNLPVAGLALLLGVDRFMSEARAITNLIGNGVATIVVARWEGALDRERLNHALRENSPG